MIHWLASVIWWLFDANRSCIYIYIYIAIYHTHYIYIYTHTHYRNCLLHRSPQWTRLSQPWLQRFSTSPGRQPSDRCCVCDSSWHGGDLSRLFSRRRWHQKYNYSSSSGETIMTGTFYCSYWQGLTAIKKLVTNKLQLLDHNTKLRSKT